MKTFKELEYQRPDFKALAKDIKLATKQIQQATSYEELKRVYLEASKKVENMQTMSAIASIRNTIDKSDEFYEKEHQAISKSSASLGLVMKKFLIALLKSPFRSDIDNEYGPYLLKENEMQLKLIKFNIIFDMIKESSLGNEYSKTVALCKTTFRGEECNFYGLLKHMESTDRATRKEAFLAWAKMYEEVSPKLDKIYDQLVKVRVKIAKKLGFKDYIEYAYLARSRFDYNAEDVKQFRESVKKYVVPLCSKLYSK